MAIKICSVDGTEYEAEAQACPECGSDTFHPWPYAPGDEVVNEADKPEVGEQSSQQDSTSSPSTSPTDSKPSGSGASPSQPALTTGPSSSKDATGSGAVPSTGGSTPGTTTPPSTPVSDNK
jgi:hypothetical protein